MPLSEYGFKVAKVIFLSPRLPLGRAEPFPYLVYCMRRRDSHTPDFPGGKVDIGLGDRSVPDALWREVHEELEIGPVMKDALQYWVRDAGLNADGDTVRLNARRVLTPSGDVHFVYLYLIVLPPIQRGFIGCLTGRDLHPRIKETRKHYRGGFVTANEAAREIHRRTSPGYADMIRDAINWMAMERGDPPIVWT